MEYISQIKLAGMGDSLHENQRRNNSDVEHLPSGGIALPLFSGLTNSGEMISKLMKWYGQDMKMFGYGLKFDNKRVFGICDVYDEHGRCC